MKNIEEYVCTRDQSDKIMTLLGLGYQNSLFYYDLSTDKIVYCDEEPVGRVSAFTSQELEEIIIEITDCYEITRHKKSITYTVNKGGKTIMYGFDAKKPLAIILAEFLIHLLTQQRS